MDGRGQLRYGRENRKRADAPRCFIGDLAGNPRPYLRPAIRGAAPVTAKDGAARLKRNC